jgi:NitT/TauT family transport system substrate-binding protein
MNCSTLVIQKGKNIRENNKIIITILLISLIFAQGFIFSGCRTDQDLERQPGPDTEEINNESKINIGVLRGPSAIGMIKIIDEAIANSENINFSYEIVGSPDIMISRIISNEIAIAVLPTNVAAKLYNKGVNIKIAAIVGGGVLYIISNRNQNIGKGQWEDLKGKEINIIARGSNPDVIFRYLADKNGIDIEKDIIIDYSFDQVELSQLLIADKKDIGMLPEPFVTGCLEENNNLDIVMDIQEEWGRVSSTDILPQTCLIFSSYIIDSKENILETFLIEYKDSIDWANNNPGKAGGMAERLGIGIKEEISEKVIPRCNLMYEDKEDAKKILDEYLKVLFKFSPEDIGGKIPESQFYYDE